MSSATAILHQPSDALSGLVLAAVERDTRDAQLADAARLNFFPASPLASISFIFEGTLHLVLEDGKADLPNRPIGPALPRLIFSGPQSQPMISWSAGPVHALMVGLYPEALHQLLGQSISPWKDKTVPLHQVASAEILTACEMVLASPEFAYPAFETAFGNLWHSASNKTVLSSLGEWIRRLTTQTTYSTTGNSLRQWQRRMHDWTGQSHRDLQRFSRVENAFIRQLSAPAQSELATVANEAGYADQSHMGREVKQVTGVSPARFNARMREDEAFWYYRLIMSLYRPKTSRILPHQNDA